MEDTEKQLKEMNDQLQNKDFLDGLSPDAEQKMKEKFAQLNEEYNRYNQQYYQFLNQGQYKIIQTIAGGINGAADKIASIKGYNMILNKQACFFYNPALDVTNDVVKEMDKAFDDEAKKAAAAAPAPTAPAKEAAPAAKEEPKKTAAVKEEAKKPTAPVAKEETKKPAATAKVEEKKNAPEAAKSR
jgi:outer membrane protein